MRKLTSLLALTSLLGCGASHRPDSVVAFGSNNSWNPVTLGTGLLNQQQHFGYWEAKPYLDKGWEGYHIKAYVRKAKPYGTYSYKSGDSSYTAFVDNPACKSGDCPYEEKAVITRLTSQGATTLGELDARDSGSEERVRLKHPSGVYIAGFDESEAQTRNLADEQQVQTFRGFDRDVNTDGVKLGSIEEMDAPQTITQPESVYDANGKFQATVIERINGDDQTHNSEWWRLSTRWCMNDDWMNRPAACQNGNHWQCILQNFKKEEYDITSCNESNQPMASYVDKGAGGNFKQLLSGRSDSTISLKRDPSSSKYDFSYRAGSELTFGSHGTRYYVKSNNQYLVYANTHEYGEKTNVGPGYYAISHAPKAKMFFANWNNNPKFQGKGFGMFFNAEKDWLNHGPEHTAMLVFEKVGDTYTTANGDRICDYSDEPYSASGSNDPEWHQFVKQCKHNVMYYLNVYVLFPPTVNGKSDWLDRLNIFDSILAAMPDQVQQSRELPEVEQFVDAARLLEKFQRAGNDPAALKLDDALDLGTEEDHLTAPCKVWNLMNSLKRVDGTCGKTLSGLPVK